MNRILYVYIVVLLLSVGCDSFPKRMHSEKVDSSSNQDEIRISVECSERANQLPFPEFKNFIVTKLYVVNSSAFPIEFTPAELVKPEHADIELTLAMGARESAKKVELRQKKSVTVGVGEDYLIDLHFGIKNEEQLQKVVFEVSGISKNNQKRLAESFICQRSKTSDQ